MIEIAQDSGAFALVTRVKIAVGETIKIAPGWSAKLVRRNDTEDAFRGCGNKGSRVIPHHHHEEELFYVVSGLVRVMIWYGRKTKSYLMGAGDQLIIPAMLNHTMKAEEETDCGTVFHPPLSVSP